MTDTLSERLRKAAGGLDKELCAVESHIDKLEAQLAEATARVGELEDAMRGHKECEKCGAFVAVWTERQIAEAKAEGKKLSESLKWE